MMPQVHLFWLLASIRSGGGGSWGRSVSIGVCFKKENIECACQLPVTWKEYVEIILASALSKLKWSNILVLEGPPMLVPSRVIAVSNRKILC